MRHRLRWWQGLALAMAAVACLLLFHRLAAGLTARQLDQQAHARLARLQAGQPLWQWSLRQPDDLIAGRVFGPGRLSKQDGALRVVSQHDGVLELGLPLDHPADLRHWSLLQLQWRPGVVRPALGVLSAASLDDPANCSTPLVPLDGRLGRVQLDLAALPWRDNHEQPCQPPGSAAMLRLRLQLPAGQAIDLQHIALAAPAGTAMAAAVPRLRQPDGAGAEQLLQTRDRWLAARPGAIVDADVPWWARFWPGPTLIGWMSALYLLTLTLLARHRAMPQALDAIVALLGPLLLIGGLQLDRQPSLAGALAMAGGLAYAGWLQWRWRPRQWRWLAPPRSWLLALAPLPLAIGLVGWLGHPLLAPRPGHLLAYLGWAALQQWLMLAVLMHGLRAWPAAAGVLSVAAVFALLHTPNGRLMQLCFLAELWWAWCFLRRPALAPIALAHAACALLLEAGLAGGDGPLRSLAVSARFFY